ncbi:hypothetical protein [Paenibacillus sp. GCM10027626]|uniref:hypothetical protein n=1 Tax=Paenibacillus sp. GCM10027626 TaxID=3273411 RepID=UPI00363C12E0
MRTGWRKLLPAAAALAAVLTISIMSWQVYGAKEQGRFELKDVSGDRAALNDVIIRGLVGDSYYRTVFQIERGEVTTASEIYARPSLLAGSSIIPGGEKRIGSRYYSIFGHGSFEVRYNERKQGMITGSGKLDVMFPELIYPEGEGEGSLSSGSPTASGGGQADATEFHATYTNGLEYGLAEIGDKLYFTVPTTKEYKGENSIYALSFDGGASKRLVAIDLSGGQTEVLGLEAVGNRLVLIRTEGTQLLVSAYDPASGKRVGEAAVPDFLAGRDADSRTDAGTKGGNHSENYEAFADDERMTLELSFRRSGDDNVKNGHVPRTIISLDLSDGVQLDGDLRVTFRDGEQSPTFDSSYMTHKDDRLYIVRIVRSVENDERSYDLTWPRHFWIDVYQAGKSVYRGELLTDVNDDLIGAINYEMTHSGFTYDERVIRTFRELSIKLRNN